MNVIEHLIECLAEECGEVAKECHKANRFGLDDQVTYDPDGPRGTTGPTNREKIITELNDLMGVVQILVAKQAIPVNWRDLTQSEAKAKKVMAFMGYAKRVGTLSE